jgi:sporulation protein YlmC with PRC-barrel domain
LGHDNFAGDVARRVKESIMSNPCISSAKVAGTAVYNSNGEKLGSIDDLVIDKISGQVRYAALEFGGFLGVGTDRYPLPWSMLKYDTGVDGYVVPLRKEQLEAAPRYAQNRTPDYNDDFGRKVYDYYGVPW